MDDRSIKVLIVEDSLSTAKALSGLLAQFDVVGIARDGREALRMQARLKPDVITMDIHLPDTDGLDLTRQILARRPVPIVIISALVSPKRQELVFEALRAGAYDVAAKSRFFSQTGKALDTHRLIKLVRSAAIQSIRSAQPSASERPSPQIAPKRRRLPSPERNLLAIGASTGGPAALCMVFSKLGMNFPMPILVAQHMAEGFMEGFVRWLNSQTTLKAHIAKHGEALLPSNIYFPPSGHNLTVAEGGKLQVEPCSGSGPCPSVNLLFHSVTKLYGARAVFLLLTGMGSDGAEGMLAARRCQAMTAAQDQDTSVVYGMPQEALRLGAAEYVLSLHQIAPWLVQAAVTAKQGLGS